MTKTLDKSIASTDRYLYLALELGGTKWVVASAPGIGGAEPVRIKTLKAGDMAALEAERYLAEMESGEGEKSNI